MNRTSEGKFKRGISGNPAGRPKSATVELRQALAKHGNAVVSKVVEAALAGDIAACRLVLDRLSPALKASAATVTFDIGDGSLADKSASILSATSQGKLPPDVACMLIGAIANHGRLIELANLEERLKVLEVQGH